MAYYASLTSLKNTTEHITYLTQTSILPEFPLIHRLYEEVNSLRIFLSLTKINISRNIFYRVYKLFSSKNNACNEVNFSHDQFIALNEELREAVCKLEDVLESHMSSILLSRHPNLRSTEVKKEIVSFISYITKIKKKYFKIIRHSMPQQAVVAASRVSDFFIGNNSSELVGLHREFNYLKHRIMSGERALKVISIHGMAGIGKTALAKAVCKDPDVWSCFDCHLFVPVGPKYLLKNILVCILSQLNLRSDYTNIIPQNDIVGKELRNCVTNNLKHKRYIILLDDVWSRQVWNDLREILPNDSNRGCVLQTTRLYRVAHRIGLPLSYLKKRFLDEVESWNLLCTKVFGKDLCPYELKKLGKKIAKKCEGLPLALISVGNHLAKAEKTKEYWEYVVEKGITSIISADDGLLKTLHPSYVHLGEHLKALFLYLGIFPEYSEIYTSKLIKLWTAEGFLELDPVDSERLALKCLYNFEYDNVVMVKQKRNGLADIKTCQLHIVYWTYCKIQASKENLFRILYTRDDCFSKGIERQHRLCIHNNSLFGIKDSYNAMASVSNLHSLLCTGLHHKYPVPFRFGLKLLRVLEVVTVRFYEFPLEVLQLVLLRYMAFTYDGDLPPSIQSLSNIWYLIVRRHHRIISPKSPSYLPKEIWKMKELRHLQVVGSDLLEPPCGELLPNLLKLLDVTPESCTKQVLESVPNLKKLGVRILLPTDAKEPMCSLDYLRNLNGLVSLLCTVVNPKPSSLVAARAYPTSIFPEGLERLSLSGFGYSWDQMSEISGRRNLRKLKLRHCAFHGPRWVIGEHEFDSLRFLLLEDIDLQYLDAGQKNIMLERAIIRHCYKLEQFPWKCVLEKIDIVDCKPSLVSTFDGYCTISAVSSWEDQKDDVGS